MLTVQNSSHKEPSHAQEIIVDSRGGRLSCRLRPIASAQPPADASLHSSSAPTLVGAWSIDVTPTLVPAFTSLGTFSADGTLTNISSSIVGLPA